MPGLLCGFRHDGTTPVATASCRTQLIGGVAAVAVGLIVAYMIHGHPEELRAPAWVAYLAGSAFVLAGLSLLAGAFAAIWLQRWLGIAVALSMLGISLWVAFGSAERGCSVSISFFRTIGADGICAAHLALDRC